MQKQGKLLIVDDEAVALRNLERVMSKAGYSVTAVQSGEEALAQLEVQAFDVLLTDLRMEKVLGLDSRTTASPRPRPWPPPARAS